MSNSYLFKHPVPPLNNVNNSYVNADNSSWPNRFASTDTSREFALPYNFSSNVAAANASQIGGVTLRRKIKNIVSKYRMPKSRRMKTKRRLMSLCKQKKRGKTVSKRRSRRRHHGGTVLNGPLVPQQTLAPVNGSNAYSHQGGRGPIGGVLRPYALVGRGGKKKQRPMQSGGYHQFGSNIPGTPSYSTGGILNASQLALANPVPYQVLSNCTNCVDNYSYPLNEGYQFWAK
jgi:hypothetical protein